MKILTGSLRGQAIEFHPNPHLRPTSDKVRKALVDSFLSAGLEGRRVLDLFSGTGAVGMEFLSCGISFASFVESDRRQAAAIRKNLERLQLGARSEVIASDAFEALRRMEKDGGEGYDIVFVDPPYSKGAAERALSVLGLSPVLKKGGWVIVESDKRNPPKPVLPGLRRVQEKLYGDTRIDIFVHD